MSGRAQYNQISMVHLVLVPVFFTRKIKLTRRTIFFKVKHQIRLEVDINSRYTHRAFNFNSSRDIARTSHYLSEDDKLQFEVVDAISGCKKSKRKRMG